MVHEERNLAVTERKKNLELQEQVNFYKFKVDVLERAMNTLDAKVSKVLVR